MSHQAFHEHHLTGFSVALAFSQFCASKYVLTFKGASFKIQCHFPFLCQIAKPLATLGIRKLHRVEHIYIILGLQCTATYIFTKSTFNKLQRFHLHSSEIEISTCLFNLYTKIRLGFKDELQYVLELFIDKEQFVHPPNSSVHRLWHDGTKHDNLYLVLLHRRKVMTCNLLFFPLYYI